MNGQVFDFMISLFFVVVASELFASVLNLLSVRHSHRAKNDD